MSEYLQTYQHELNILVVYDADCRSATSLAEKFVADSPKFDAVVAIGPFCHKTNVTQEELAAAEGDMASVIAQLENICCRVIYLAGENDPPNSHLTPNSVNIHTRRMTLMEGLFLSGYTETNQNLKKSKVPDNFDRSAES